MNNLINQTLENRYHITALLGQGGMGAVYRARDLTLRHEVMLKLMHAHLTAQKAAYSISQYCLVHRL